MLFGAAFFTSKCNKKFSELLGLCLLLPATACGIIAYNTNLLGDDLATQNAMMHANGVLYIITANFLAIDYLPHLAIRLILILTNTTNKVIVGG